MPEEGTSRPRRSKQIREANGGVAPRRPTVRRKRPRTMRNANDNDTGNDNGDDGDHPTGLSPHLPQETNPARVSRPTPALIHESMANSWQLNRGLQMCFIFDAVSPARWFKRGVLFTEEGTFPDYNEGEAGYATETDVDDPGLMQYAVYKYT